MALDKEQFGNFVGVLIAQVRCEISESKRLAERLGEALKHNRDTRAGAEAALKTSRAERAARAARLTRAAVSAAQKAG